METFTAKDFTIIDAHAHIFPDKISEKATGAIGEFYGIPMSSVGTSEKLVESGKEIGVWKYLVCSTATVARQVESINTFISEECSKFHEFLGFGTLHPDMDNIGNEVDRIISLGLRGIKIHPDFQKFNIDDESAFEMYDIIQGRLPILVHMGDNRHEYSKPHRLSNIMDKFPHLEVIAAHFGGYQCWEEATEVLCGRKNIKFDTCSSLPMIESSYAKKLIGNYGIENMFFGTDFPMWRHSDEINRFFQIGLNFDDNSRILSGNFKEYFQM